jgi:trimethylamine--corrinoid protein Co-methyltransferase
MANYADAFYEAELSNNDNVENWEAEGSKDMRVRAFEKWNRMLREYEAPAIDPATREELQAYVARRKQELPDAWY